MSMQVMQVETSETKHAFRVNGITLAKRHLMATLGKDCDEMGDKVLYKFLTIVPFLHKSYQVNSEASESIKYGAAKAHRVWEALKLTEDAIVPFMLVMMAQSGGGDDPRETVKAMGQQLREAGFYEGGKATSFRQGERQTATILPFPGKHTLH